MPIPFDFDTLKLIWWVLLGVLLIGFAIMDGFDMGVAALLPFVGKTDGDRRIIINTVGPVWEGNQVWLILGAGAIFAAWPMIYAVAFSGFYCAMFLVLAALIIRPVGFKFRSKLTHPTWRTIWDWGIFTGGIVPALVFGVAVGNVIEGVPFYIDQQMMPHYIGSFWDLFTPFTLMCGGVSASMLIHHGALYLAIKTENPLSSRALKVVNWTTLITLGLFALAGLYVASSLEGYKISSDFVANAAANPLAKSVVSELGAWVKNYDEYSWMIAAPALGFVATLLSWHGKMRDQLKSAFILSASAIFGIIATVGLSLYPFIIPSSYDPRSSLTIWDASSSRMTLFIMLCATTIFLPIIVGYTTWAYRVLAGKVTNKSLSEDINSY
ncbi:cytochrome d ubiquinol oxidase subunit II [Candidatus Odyssella acanthamoebae]|uniref:Cytochrome d ubiquinol oxidase subunit 2 n=1 Tax=Candidatus Odyssella acanthamoebae TaxID=91604 RepID=A0A077AZ32_9PROT|nr:cytochrome d ubiquinol oxidase subunit II [Candidatus Paracaedibacter acanthamoebae]AIK95955.1 cytochrome d ubiquinol oxidase subunit 2 [Candidatus Paracaedibacter acanthamoebae]